MKKKIQTKITSSLIVVILALAMLLSVVLPTFGQAQVQGNGIVKLDNVINNYQQYFDSSVMFKLPSTIKETDDISVIIMLDDSAIVDAYNKTNKSMTLLEYSLTEEADKIRASIAAEKNSVLSRLHTAGVSYSTGVDYDTVFSGFEIVIKAKDFATTCSLLSSTQKAIIGEVYNVAETQLVNNKVDYYEETGIFDSSSFGYDGTGTVVAVLDTGLDYTHSAFSVENFVWTESTLGLTKKEVSEIIGKTEAAKLFPGLTADDVYLNAKVPFSFDYADEDSDVYSMHNNHGTHVSGVIVGKDKVITGVAPNAQLVSMKIFSDTMDTARSSWILAALEDCVLLGVDVINMSLGTSCGFSREDDKEQISGVYDKIRAAGISLVVAASNSYNSAYGSEKNGNLPLTSNPDCGTVGSPSTYDGALSVASIAGEKTPYILYGNTIMYFIEATNSASEEKNFFDEILPSTITDNSFVDFEYVTIPGAGRNADYIGLDMTNKIALVRRGSTTFEEKATAAAKAGAAGIIIYNNVAGDIKMNAGRVNIPICSLGQDDGEILAAQETGVIRISRSQKSGPFISDFSSWGPTPDLRIKPEITAHGGNILSAVTASTGESGYDRLSGTSMACPNIAGVTALMRQYVMDKFPELKNDPVEATALINRLLMSTADVMLNQNGLPYAVRKQGAGLANLTSAGSTTAYIMTYDRLDGSLMDKSKIELGDDKNKTGVYTLKFSVNNFGYYDLTYDVNAYVMTEGVSETKTHQGETTVTQEGYILGGAKVEITSISGGTKDGMRVVIPAGEVVDLTVTITLSDADKKYLDDSFENGMYVEGFLRLNAVSGTEVSLGVPYLAFYGDWTQAPLFDLDYYETNADELDDSIELLDKTLPDAYATRPVGSVESDYISYLGAYYFIQDPKNKPIAADRDRISISIVEGSVHTLDAIWAGMLRNAEKVVITITDSSTGEVIFETTDYNVRKSYGDGGSIYPAGIDIDFDAKEHNLKNNTRYDVKVQGYIDYENGGLETNEKNTFEFPFYTDFEAPALTDVTFRTEYDKDQQKMRLFATLAIYDNHYAMGMQVGYIGQQLTSNNQYEMLFQTFDTYPVPIYSTRNNTTYVEYELTDYVYEIKANSLYKNSFAVACYDYALNEATYEVPLPDDFIDVIFDFDEETEGNQNSLTLSVNEVYSLNPIVYPNGEWSEFIEYSCANKNVVRVVNNRIVAVGTGKAKILVNSPTGAFPEKEILVTVIGEDHPDFKWFAKPVLDVFEVTGYETLMAYYVMSTEDRDIGTTGQRTFFTGNLSVKMYPSESIKILYTLYEYFPEATEVKFESANDSIVTVDKNGVIVARQEGYSSVSISIWMDKEMTYYSQTISIEVKDPYVNSGPALTHYYGNGGTVVIPEDLHLTSIGAFAFSNFEYIAKDPSEIYEDDNSTTKQWFIGDERSTEIGKIKKVILPEGIEKIDPYAFANLTALEEVVLPSTIQVIEYGAFYGCTRLSSIKGIENVQLINDSAFFGCSLNGTIKLTSAYAIADYAFANNTQLDELVFAETLRSIGAYAFANNSQLKKVDSKADSIKYGAGVFYGCISLTKYDMKTAVIPREAFAGCRQLTSVTIGEEVAQIGELAFYGTGISSFTVEEGNKLFKTQNSGQYLVNDKGDTLVLVAPKTDTVFVLSDANITTIGNGAFSGNSTIKEVVIPYVTNVSDYAFYSCNRINTITQNVYVDKLGAIITDTAIIKENLDANKPYDVAGEFGTIGKYAFASTAVTSIPALSSQLDKIGDYAFAYSKLEIVDLSAYNGIEIGEGAFYNCKELRRVILGDNFTIGEGAFMRDREFYDSDVESVPYYTDENGKKVYYVAFKSNLGVDKTETVAVEVNGKITYVTNVLIEGKVEIGANAVIGKAAFFGAVNLKKITVGEGAVICDSAFYNASSLVEFEGLDKAVTIGDYAFSGDVYYDYVDRTYSTPYVKDDMYVYRKFASKLAYVDLSSATEIGMYAFQHSEQLETVVLGDKLESLSTGAFSNCPKLTNINLDKVVYVGEEVFAESGLVEVDLSSAKVIGKYAFITNANLVKVTLNPAGCVIGEGAFANCVALSEVENLDKVTSIGTYAFAYAALASADLSSAVSIGDYAFTKETLTPFAVILGDSLVELGDNPFAMCKLAPFSITAKDEFGYEYNVYTYDVSDTVKVINGSLYHTVPMGLELITFTESLGKANEVFKVANGTVRIGGMAFAGSDIRRVDLPETLNTIGHKAFYGCTELYLVVFNSFYAPILEEEFDQYYHDTFENIPATGEYEFTINDGSLDGQAIVIKGIEIVPYYMWNVSSDGYPTVYYGANFINYIGHINEGDKILMIRPSNGNYYETFIYGQYFNTVIDGTAAPDDATLEAIEKISALPEKIYLEHEHLVIAAREAYNKIVDNTQLGLVTEYYSILLKAENRIKALKGPQNDTPVVDTPEVEEEVAIRRANTITVLVITAVLATVGVIAVVIRWFVDKKAALAVSGNKNNEGEKSSASDAGDNTSGK